MYVYIVRHLIFKFKLHVDATIFQYFRYSICITHMLNFPVFFFRNQEIDP